MKKYSLSTLFKLHLILLSIATVMLTIGLAALVPQYLFGGGNAVKLLIAINLLGGPILGLVVITMSVFFKMRQL